MSSDLQHLTARTRMRIQRAFRAFGVTVNERACGAESARAFIYLKGCALFMRIPDRLLGASLAPSEFGWRVSGKRGKHSGNDREPGTAQRCDCGPTSGRAECAYRALNPNGPVCARTSAVDRRRDQSENFASHSRTSREDLAKLSRMTREDSAGLGEIRRDHADFGGNRRDSAENRGLRQRWNDERG